MARAETTEFEAKEEATAAEILATRYKVVAASVKVWLLGGRPRPYRYK